MAQKQGFPKLSAAELDNLLTAKLLHNFSVQPEDATDEHFYNALVLVLRDMMRECRISYVHETHEQNAKQVYYLCMEFLMGRSLKNTLFNCNLTDTARKVLKKHGVKLDALYELEPDAGLGNGGLGRLAACFLDGLASQGYPAIGYSLLYEYGIFRQKLVDGWQTEMPDFWLPGGSSSWLLPRPELNKKVLFGGQLEECWDGDYHHVMQKNATEVIAQAYDLMVAGKDGKGVSTLRLWKSTAPGMDMSLFNQGDYMRAMEQKAMAEVITQVLYPADNHREGKSLRLSQQYFLVSASVQDIVQRHLETYGTMDNLPEMAAIHINDTHPTLAIPELMRILLDECGYTWDDAFGIVSRTVAYTNHTVMAEALECWPEDLFARRLPRIYQIVCEINKRYCAEMMRITNDMEKVSRMAIVGYGLVKMANLCVAVSHAVNGVSKLHSEILKDTVFHDAYTVTPYKFKNVTNGIAHRRWLCQANPALSKFISERIGDGFVLDAGELEKLRPYVDDPASLEEFMAVKRQNKAAFADYLKKTAGVTVDPDTLFDVQVKRLHEYKRQHLNALHIVSRYLELKDNPNLDVQPRTYLFGAKSAPGYYLAKEIIRFICNLGKEIEADPVIREKLRVVYLEDYRVSLAERLMPSADISEQISLAGTEASGTGNMKLMMNGAVTLGTLDGANVEIYDAVGKENMFLFGMSTPEAVAMKQGYDPFAIYNRNETIHRAVDFMYQGFGGRTYTDVANSLIHSDPYMVLADFEDYCRAQRLSGEVYGDREKWAKMALTNTAASGVFASDRSIRDYAERIWHAEPLK